MQSDVIGGFPPIKIIRKKTNLNEKKLETRGFSTTNIVDIGKIMESKKKESFFNAFGTENEDDMYMFVNSRPHEFNDIKYKDVSNAKKNNS